MSNIITIPTSAADRTPAGPLLQNCLENYLAARELSKVRAASMRCSLRHFEQFLGRPATRDDLDESTLDQWTLALTAGKLSSGALANYRQMMRCLANDVQAAREYPPEAYEWHRKPAGHSQEYCPLCGANGTVFGSHRKIENGRGARRYAVRKRTKDGWLEKEVGKPFGRRCVRLADVVRAEIRIDDGHVFAEEQPAKGPPTPAELSGESSLNDYCAHYISGRDVASTRAVHIGWSIRSFRKFLGRVPKLTDLTDRTLNCWIDAALASGLSRRTVHSQRADMMTLWRAAYADELVESLPRRVKKISVPRLIPAASSPGEVGKLVDLARKLKGSFVNSGVGRAEFFVATIAMLWETGLRMGDVLRIEREHVQNGVLVLTQGKTGWPIVCPLSADCLRAIEATQPENRRRIFGDALSRGCIDKGFRKLAKAAGFNGGTKKIRKSGATAVEAATPGAAMAYLGHKTPGLAFKHYIDPRLVGNAKPLVPELPGFAEALTEMARQSKGGAA